MSFIKPKPSLPGNPSIQHPPSARPQPPQMWAYWPQPVTPRPLASGPNSLALLGLGVALIVALTLLVAVLLALFYRSDRIIPGVSIDGVAVGGRSSADAMALLQQHWAQRQIILAAGQTTQTVQPAALGLTLDTAATGELARRQGRSLATLRELIKNRGLFQLAPVYRYDPAIARQTLETLAPQLDVPPVEAGLSLVNGRVEVTSARMGQSLDVTATLAQLSQNPDQVLSQGRLPLVMLPVAPRLTDVSGPLAQANQLLTNSIAIRAYDPIRDETVEWQLEPAVWSNWLSLEISLDDPTQLAWSLDANKMQTFLAGEAGQRLGPDRYLELDQAIPAITAALKSQNWPVQLRIYHHPQQHTVQPGETLSSIGYDYGIPYPWIEQTNPGLGSLSPGQVITIPSPDALLPLPVVEHKRLVVSLSQQKLWAYENGALKWEWPVSTGIASSPTAPGVFQVQTHVANAYAANWNLWMPNFLGIYRPVPTSDFMNGFHGFPTRNGSTLLWTDDLGHRVTYGCILVSSTNAALLYDWAEDGVVVEVQR